MHISIAQFFWILATMEVTMTVWLTISPTATLVGQDAWIAILLGGFIGVGVTFAVSKISVRYPGLTFIELTQNIFGKWLGKLISLYYLLGWYSVTVIILRTMAEFVQLILFFHTSSIVISAIMVLLMVYITHLGGITAIGRFSQIVGPIFFVVIVASILLNLPNIDFHHIMPVYADHGMIPIMKASVIHGSFLSESILVMILIPLLLKPKKAPGTAVLAVSISSAVVIITTAMVIMTFGPQLSGNFINPYFNMVRFISALDFIQNMDVWVVFIWLFCVFIKLSMYMFITSYGTAQWLHIRNWKKVIWYLGAFYLFASIVPPNIAVVFTDYLNTVWLPLIFWPNMIIIPLIMLGISFVKKPK